MSLRIDNEKFEIAHEAFKQHMLRQSGGVPFTSFRHPDLRRGEIAYKWEIYSRAQQVLDLRKWDQWIKIPGRIIDALKEACSPSISSNLLEHRYGPQRYSESALYKADRSDLIAGLERQLFDFFLGGDSTPSEFAPRFDALAKYLRDKHLGCKWAFLAYLAFLLDPQTYFPVLPTRFDKLLGYYGISKSVSGYVSWDRYSILLDLAEVLKSKLAMYGQPDAIEIQSYMWVVSGLVMERKLPKRIEIEMADFNSELSARVQRARERERIGLLGEQFIYETERTKLKEAGRADLVSKVQLVSSTGDGFGFDVLSFTPDGKELHIEVKTTTRSPLDDDGFWLSEIERLQAEQDVSWVIYRVYNIDSSPSYENIGNIVIHTDQQWELNASVWYVRRRKDIKGP